MRAIRAFVCYWLFMALTRFVPTHNRLAMALLPYAGDWAYRDYG